MKHIKLIVATALVLAATPAFAVDWVYVSSDSTGTIYYYDADTIRRSGSQVTVWEKEDASRNKTVKYREQKIQSQFSCSDRTYRLLSFVTYYPDGKKISYSLDTYEQKVEVIPPDTIGETRLEAACSATAP
jgi:hypothetical protein